jgi:hypothetical protein
MSDRNRMGFIRWQFKDAHKSLSFWGFMVVILGVIMMLAGCPAPWPFYTAIAGVSMSVIDAGIAWYRFSRAVYEMEQDRIVRELKKKAD